MTVIVAAGKLQQPAQLVIGINLARVRRSQQDFFLGSGYRANAKA